MVSGRVDTAMGTTTEDPHSLNLVGSCPAGLPSLPHKFWTPISLASCLFLSPMCSSSELPRASVDPAPAAPASPGPSPWPRCPSPHIAWIPPPPPHHPSPCIPRCLSPRPLALVSLSPCPLDPPPVPWTLPLAPVSLSPCPLDPPPWPRCPLSASAPPRLMKSSANRAGATRERSGLQRERREGRQSDGLASQPATHVCALHTGRGFTHRKEGRVQGRVQGSGEGPGEGPREGSGEGPGEGPKES